MLTFHGYIITHLSEVCRSYDGNFVPFRLVMFLAPKTLNFARLVLDVLTPFTIPVYSLVVSLLSVDFTVLTALNIDLSILWNNSLLICFSG